MSRNARWLLAGAALAAVASVAAATALLGRPTADPIARWTDEVSRAGAAGAWHSLVGDDDWPRVLAQMRSGNVRALQLGLQLCSAADTAPGEELLDVLAEATKTHPRLILERGSQCAIGYRGLCSWMSAKSTVGDSRDGVMKEMRLRRKAVMTVEDSSLAQAREACLEGIAEGELPGPGR